MIVKNTCVLQAGGHIPKLIFNYVKYIKYNNVEYMYVNIIFACTCSVGKACQSDVFAM